MRREVKDLFFLGGGDMFGFYLFIFSLLPLLQLVLLGTGRCEGAFLPFEIGKFVPFCLWKSKSFIYC